MTTYHRVRDFERKYKEKMERILSEYYTDALSDHAFLELYYTALDMWDEEEHGDIEHRKKLAERAHNMNHYLAFLLRNDLDGAWQGHPYPQPISDRLKALWSLAQYFYHLEDPNGFLGPSSAELGCIIRAMVAAKRLGNDQYDDILDGLHPHQEWWSDTRDCDEYVLDNEEFKAWLQNDGIFYMFVNRAPREQHESARENQSDDDEVCP